MDGETDPGERDPGQLGASYRVRIQEWVPNKGSE